MFVRWKRQQRKPKQVGWEDIPGSEYVSRIIGKTRMHQRRVFQDEYLLSAHLVESVRIDGKPRQKTIGYLGSIREARLQPGDEYSASHRGYFWSAAEARMSQMNLTDQERTNVIDALAKRVPKVSTEEAAANDARLDAIEARLRSYGL